jgi:hypothetical protein
MFVICFVTNKDIQINNKGTTLEIQADILHLRQ